MATSSESIAPCADAAQMRSLLLELQDEAVRLALPAISICGLALIASAVWFRDQLHAGFPGMLLLLLPVVAWRARGLGQRAAAWAVSVGLLAVDLIVVAWPGIDAALCLLMLPVGFATVSLGAVSGVLLAIGCSLLLLLAPRGLVPGDVTLRVIGAIGVWGSVGLLWLDRRPLLTALQWSWSSQEQSRRLLERARDYQVQLKQTLADLTDANLQLTRLNRLANGLRQAAEEARQAKARFVANVSHELRTPLNMIIGFSEMILQVPETYGTALPPALLADLAVILRNSQHLSSLIDDVLDLSQIETRRMALSKERVAFPEIVEAAAAVVRRLFESKGLFLKVELAEGLPRVFCDRTRIREVVINLLSNAGRFTERGGVWLRVWQESGDVVVSVTDTGPGIPDQERDKIFRPFHQLEGSMRRRRDGSGLGLSISRSFVELHGGRMWLESEAGAGTTFYFRLPVDPPAPADEDVSRWFNPHWHYEERTRRSLAAPPTTSPRYVVWEAGLSLQRLLGRYLEGAELVPVSTLEKAARELARVPAQALLVNNASVTDALQQVSEAAILPPGTPAIICSFPGPGDAAVALGVSGYLVKPISREVLLAALDRLATGIKTLLVVDDEPEALQLFWRMLSSAERGYHVLTAANGREGLQVLRQERPDAMLLDLVMPEMDGFRVLEVCSQDPALQDIPVVVISARDPTGQPIVTSALAITRVGGLSTEQLLACIEGASRLLAAAPPADPAPREASSG